MFDVFPRIDDSRSSTEGVERWQPLRGTLWCEHGSLIILLSLRTGRYYMLNDLGARVWAGINSRLTAIEIGQDIIRTGGQVEPTVLEDVKRLLAELARIGLVEPVCRTPGRLTANDINTATHRFEASHSLSQCGSTGRGVLRKPSLIACVVCLSFTRCLLKATSLRRALIWAYGRSVPTSSEPPDDDWIRSTARQVALAGSVCPFSVQCLEKSLCFLWLTRRAGLDARLRFGVLPNPFSAHAWIEHRDVPINDAPEHLGMYCHFSAIEPGAF
jgi:hypothetical protein